MMEILTKENFWNEMEQKYPKAMKHFQNWIDGYKKANQWQLLFNGMVVTHLDSDTKQPQYTFAPKYHELPIAMQFGIFVEFITYSEPKLNKPFYPYKLFLNLRKNIDLVARNKIERFLKELEDKV